jgi:diguanylate cyclase (GGDEF)-like protein
MNEYLVVCIDDDEQFLASLAGALPSRVEALCTSFKCFFEFVSSAEELFQLLASTNGTPPLGMVISDQIMPGIDGIRLIEMIKTDKPDVASILLTGHAGLDSARYAINHQLLDQYVAKPIEDMDEFASTTANLLKHHHLNLEEQLRTVQLAQSNEDLRKSNEKVRAMQAAAESVAKLSKGIKCLDFTEVVDMISRDVPKLFNAERGVFCLVTENGELDLVRRANCPCPSESLLRADVKEAFACGQIHLNGVPDVCVKLGSKAPEILVPLNMAELSHFDNKSLHATKGYFCLCGSENDQANSLDVLAYKAELLGEILSVSLTNAALYEQAKRDGQIDSLTGAFTRRVLDDRLQLEHARMQRYKHPCCVILMDIDNFKHINDEAGHLVGDQTLQKLAEILAHETRQTDIIVRYGGDEFVVLMPETDITQAADVAERIRQKSESGLAELGRPLTVSCGVATWSGADGETSTDLIRRADVALYRAKASGRNKVITEQAA